MACHLNSAKLLSESVNIIIWNLGNKFQSILIKLQQFSLKEKCLKCHMKVSFILFSGIIS